MPYKDSSHLSYKLAEVSKIDKYYMYTLSKTE